MLPGVNVEASSPVLIEKSRSAVTDGEGRYIIQDLRPGTYRVAFTLPGFKTVVRESLELLGTSVVTVNADMAIGTVEETITVSGATPTVDLQSTTRQVSITQEIVSALPSSRNSIRARRADCRASGRTSAAATSAARSSRKWHHWSPTAAGPATSA